MSIAFKCSSCGRGLRANADMVGKRTKCPGCATVLTIPGLAGDTPHPQVKSMPSTARTTTAAASAGPIVACEACGAKIRAKAEWAGKVIKCPKCEGRIKVPGGATPSAIKAAAPKRPAPSPIDEDLDDVEEPDDEDEEAKPKGKKKKKAAAKKSNMGLLIALVAVVVVVGGGFAGWMLLFSEPKAPGPVAKIPGKGLREDDGEGKKTNRGPAGNAFDSIPSDAIGFINIKPQSFLKSELGKKALAGLEQDAIGAGKVNKEIKEAFGVGVADIVDAVVVFRDLSFVPDNPAAPPIGNPLESMLVIIAFEASFDPKGFEETFEGQNFEKKETDDKPYYVIGRPGQQKAMYEAATNVIVFGEEKTIVSFLKADRPKDGPLAPYIKTASVGKHLVYMGSQNPPEIMEKAKKDPNSKQFQQLIEAKSSEFIISEEGGLNALVKIEFPDADKAENAKNWVVTGLIAAGAMVPTMKKNLPEDLAAKAEAAFRTIKPKVEGATLEIPLKTDLTFDDIGSIAEQIAPMVMKMQGGAPEQIAVNNVKQLALAMHNHHDRYRALPEAKIGGGLSWRVAILPYIEADNLYKLFKLDEPWDSEHNKALLPMMPQTLEHPLRKAPPGYTFYRVFVGPNTLFAEGKKMTFAGVRDGTTNTLMIVEAAEAVPWTKPEELVFNPTGPLPRLGDPARGGAFIAALADASTWIFRRQDEATIRAMITPSGGEIVDLGKLLK
jgi:DNA-directed RNA polymerase subunit RPC12/RpoP